MDIERQLDAPLARRFAAEDRYLTRLEKREAIAELQVGELMREGKTIYYCSKTEGSRHRYFESASKQAVLDYLIRHRYA